MPSNSVLIIVVIGGTFDEQQKSRYLIPHPNFEEYLSQLFAPINMVAAQVDDIILQAIVVNVLILKKKLTMTIFSQ